MSKRSKKQLERDRFTFDWFGMNRTMCDCLSDMRKCLESLNFSPLKGLIEEAQIMANRMESALYDQKDLVKLSQKVREARRYYKELEDKCSKLNDKIESKK